MKSVLYVVAVFSLVAFVAGTATATLIVNGDVMVDANGKTAVLWTGSSPAVAGTQTWNGLAPDTPAGNLVDKDGNATSVGALVYSTVGPWNSGWSTSHILEDFCNYNFAYSTDPSTWSTTAYLAISGLDANKTYDLYVYCGVEGGTYGLSTNPTDTRSAPTTGGYTDGPDVAPWVENANYVKFSDVAATAYTDGTDNYVGLVVGFSGNVSGFTLVEVPEPSTLALLSAGLIGLLAYAWRKRK